MMKLFTSMKALKLLFIAVPLIFFNAVLFALPFQAQFEANAQNRSLVLLFVFCAVPLQILTKFKAIMFAVIVFTTASIFGLISYVPGVRTEFLLIYSCLMLFTSYFVFDWIPNTGALPGHLKTLWANRFLLRLWIHYNIRSRYSQTLLGILWIIVLPLSTSLILAFVFSFVLRLEDIGNVPFVSFFLIGLTFWSFFNQSVLTSTMSLRAKLDLINQIYFPREVLVLAKVGEAAVDLIFMMASILLINFCLGLLPNTNFVYLPLLLLIQISFQLGLMFFLSYLSVFIRDMPQLTAVVLQLWFYITPIIYPITIFPQEIRYLFELVNPLAPLISSYRAIIIYNQAPDFLSLCIPIAVSSLLLFASYLFFKANERHLADFK